MRTIMLVALVVVGCSTATAVKLAPRYSLFRNIALHSTSNRFDKSVYTGGWVKSGADVHAWREGLTLSEILRASGGLLFKDDEDHELWPYTVSVFRPTAEDPDPLHACYSTLVLPQRDNYEDRIAFALQAEDVILVTREKAAKQGTGG